MVTLNLIEQRDSKCKEAINILRSSIEFAEKERRVLALTGCNDPEGTWKIGVNLASSFAKLGKKAVFLDANLRDESLKKFYRADIGLAEYLQEKASFNEIVYATNMDELDIILPGNLPDTPSELLGGSRFEELVLMLRKRYDYIIVNTPPIHELIDGIMIGRISDGVICVIDDGRTKYKQAEEMKIKLERSGCHILGCVFNQLPNPKKSFMRLL